MLKAGKSIFARDLDKKKGLLWMWQEIHASLLNTKKASYQRYEAIINLWNMIALDGVNTSVPGGWLNGNWKQLYIQFAYVCAVVGYAFVVTALIAKGMDMIPMFRLRESPEAEVIGMDDAQVRRNAHSSVIIFVNFCVVLSVLLLT